MPTYAYHCDNCGVEFERFQKFADKPLTRCPECKGKVRRVPQVSAVVFKGSGWYVNDSRSKSSVSASSNKKSDSGESKPESAKPDSAASDSQPESKPESKPKSKASDD